MREIQVQKLTKDNFGKYGEFLDLLDESELKKKSIFQEGFLDRKSTRLNSSHASKSRMPSSA